MTAISTPSGTSDLPTESPLSLVVEALTKPWGGTYPRALAAELATTMLDALTAGGYEVERHDDLQAFRAAYILQALR